MTKFKFNLKSLKEDALKPLLLVGGVVLGCQAGKLLKEKVLKVEDGDTGIKQYITPLVQLVLGTGGAMLLKNQNLKLIAYGVTGSGIITGVKVLLKKDILALGEAPDNVIDLRIDKYNPELPVIQGTSGNPLYLPVDIADEDEELVGYTEYDNISTNVDLVQ